MQSLWHECYWHSIQLEQWLEVQPRSNYLMYCVVLLKSRSKIVLWKWRKVQINKLRCKWNKCDTIFLSVFLQMAAKVYRLLDSKITNKQSFCFFDSVRREMSCATQNCAAKKKREHDLCWFPYPFSSNANKLLWFSCDSSVSFSWIKRKNWFVKMIIYFEHHSVCQPIEWIYVVAITFATKNDIYVGINAFVSRFCQSTGEDMKNCHQSNFK